MKFEHTDWKSEMPNCQKLNPLGGFIAFFIWFVLGGTLYFFLSDIIFYGFVGLVIMLSLLFLLNLFGIVETNCPWNPDQKTR